jgi:predicted TIM-barrel fold metal-dependent hydrolase
MKNNKNRIHFFLILSLLLNLILGVFLFRENQIRFKFWGLRVLGFLSPKSLPDFRDDLRITEFNPKPLLTGIEDGRPNKLPSFPVVETHGHIGRFFKTTPEGLTKSMDQAGIKFFINLSFTTGDDYVKLQKEYNDPRIVHFSTFNWKRMEESDDFVNLMLSDLRKDIENGSKGIKLWKNFGLSLKKKNGQRLKLSDPILDSLFQECAKHGLIISIHTVDPPSFFFPINSENERYEELIRKPEWSFYGTEYPSFEEVLEERNELFKRHKNLKFIALHFGEYAHDLEKAAKILEDHPNVYLDIAARIDELGRQPYRARDFFIKWQDRIFFGTDGPVDLGKFEIYSRFLETKDEYFDYYPNHKSRKGFWKIYGIELPKEVLEKIYYKNAYSFFNLGKK